MSDPLRDVLRCGGCGADLPMGEMHAHIAECDGWVTYEGHELADLVREAGFDPVYVEPGWFQRVVLRRKARYEL